MITYYWKEKNPSTYSRKKGFFSLMIYREKYHLYSIPSDDYPGYLKVSEVNNHSIFIKVTKKLSTVLINFYKKC